MWSMIPREILELILALLSLIELACVASVCAPWRRITRQFAIDRRLSIRHLPWTILSSRPEPQISALLSPISCPTPNWCRRCCGVYEDWLVIADQLNDLYLHHPLLRRRIPLPHQSTLPLYQGIEFFSHILFANPYLVHKVILSSPPTSNACVVVVLYGQDELAYCRLGDRRWTGFELHNLRRWHYEDAVFYKGNLVVVDSNECVWTIQFGPDRTTRQLILWPGPDWFVARLYSARYVMVSAAGRLMMVVRRRILVHPTSNKRWFRKLRTVYFRIFELDLGQTVWHELVSLGNQLMFLGQSVSAVVPAEEIKEEFGEDAIYFTECGRKASAMLEDMGIFLLAEQRIMHFDAGNSGDGGGSNDGLKKRALFFSMFNYSKLY